MFEVGCHPLSLLARLTHMNRKTLLYPYRTLRAIGDVIARPPYARAGSYLSPLTCQEDIRRQMSWQDDALGVSLNEAGQLALASSMRDVLASSPPGPRYREANNMFGGADAAIYRAMLSRLRPSRIIEAGSGFSTAVALDEADAVPVLAGLEVTCIEPYPSRLEGLLKSDDAVTLLRQPVQDVSTETFAKLGADDVLFIDSSHVAKAGSDVAWLLLHVLPRLAPGVVVHVHDIFWPFTYQATWLAEGRDWNEAYFLHAFLSGNTSWEIILFASWLWREHPELVPERLAGQRPGSIWLRKTA